MIRESDEYSNNIQNLNGGELSIFISICNKYESTYLDPKIVNGYKFDEIKKYIKEFFLSNNINRRNFILVYEEFTIFVSDQILDQIKEFDDAKLERFIRFSKIDATENTKERIIKFYIQTIERRNVLINIYPGWIIYEWDYETEVKEAEKQRNIELITSKERQEKREEELKRNQEIYKAESKRNIAIFEA